MNDLSQDLSPVAVVTTFYDAIAQGQPDRIRELAEMAFAEDIRVELPASLPYGGVVEGARRLSRMFQAMAGGLIEVGPSGLQMETLIDGGDRVVAEVSFEYTRTGEAAPVRSRALELWTFQSGRAARIEAYYWDTAPLIG